MSVTAFAPGRVNLIGEHIDYLGGRVMPMALDLGTTCTVEFIDGAEHQAVSQDYGDARWALGRPPMPTGQWFDYVAGALAALPQAVRVTLSSTLPQGTGLSSSASLLVALVTARNALLNTPASPLDVALEARRIEVEHIGLNCGIMDQYASALGIAGHALRIDCDALTHEPVAVSLGGAELWAVDSKAPRKLAGGVYNERVAECQRIRALAGIDNLFEVTMALPDPLNRRLRHIQSEAVRVELFSQASAAGDVVTMGNLLNACHRSLSDDYEVAGAALDALQLALSSTVGCYGARMMGGGFGGCVLALMDAQSVPEAQARVAQHYGDTQWIRCVPSDGARLL